MVLNKTNLNRLGRATGASNAGEAIGKKVNVYHDPDVEFGGKMIGGIRLRKAAGEEVVDIDF